eukprot:366099-Chlamydomonas_euryale.AAC.2
MRRRAHTVEYAVVFVDVAHGVAVQVRRHAVGNDNDVLRKVAAFGTLDAQHEGLKEALQAFQAEIGQPHACMHALSLMRCSF